MNNESWEEHQLESARSYILELQKENADLRAKLAAAEEEISRVIEIDNATRKARVEEMEEFLNKYDIEYDCGWRSKIDDLINGMRAKLGATYRAIESLTPGGSEFHEDPQRCVDHIKQFQDGLYRKMVKETAARKEAEAHNALLMGALQNLLPYAEDWSGDGSAIVNAKQALQLSPSEAYERVQGIVAALEAWESIYVGGSYQAIGKCPKCGNDMPSISQQMCRGCAVELTKEVLERYRRCK